MFKKIKAALNRWLFLGCSFARTLGVLGGKDPVAIEVESRW
jgi:hypothetical protein